MIAGWRWGYIHPSAFVERIRHVVSSSPASTKTWSTQALLHALVSRIISLIIMEMFDSEETTTGFQEAIAGSDKAKEAESW
jgi:hypothetical protein